MLRAFVQNLFSREPKKGKLEDKRQKSDEWPLRSEWIECREWERLVLFHFPSFPFPFFSSLSRVTKGNSGNAKEEAFERITTRDGQQKGERTKEKRLPWLQTEENNVRITRTRRRGQKIIFAAESAWWRRINETRFLIFLEGNRLTYTDITIKKKIEWTNRNLSKWIQTLSPSASAEKHKKSEERKTNWNSNERRWQKRLQTSGEILLNLGYILA